MEGRCGVWMGGWARGREGWSGFSSVTGSARGERERNSSLWRLMFPFLSLSNLVFDFQLYQV